MVGRHNIQADAAHALERAVKGEGRRNVQDLEDRPKAEESGLGIPGASYEQSLRQPDV